MTPKRQKWWNSLPTEEKRVRSFIAAEKSAIKVAKGTINSDGYVNFGDMNYEKNAISASKHLLKLLRKQLAMNIQLRNDFRNNRYFACANCKAEIHSDFYCWHCGQKLRWK